MWAVVIVAVMTSRPCAAQTVATPLVPKGLDWALLPAVNFNSDDGFGLGAAGTVYYRERTTLPDPSRPYLHAVTVRVFATTKGLHSHLLRWDAPGVVWPWLRLTAEAGYFALGSGHYCGVGNGVRCSEADAAAHVQAQGLSPAAAASANRDYYKLRYTRPYASVLAVARSLRPNAVRLEVFAGWRLAYYASGTPGVEGPYPQSLYAQHFGSGERGFVGLAQLGVARDSRDVEAAPSSGSRVEASLRLAQPWLGSDYAFWGGNLTAMAFWRPVSTSSWVFAGRAVVDAVQGALPIGELSRIGSTRLYGGFGGGSAGRGIRQSRYLGELRAFSQFESRVTPWRFSALARVIDVGFTAFFDLGTVRSTRPTATQNWLPHLGTGGGLRVTVNRDFVARADVGVAPVEGWTPRLYINLGHVF